MNRTRTLDDATFASDPGRIVLSHAKLRLLRPDLYGFQGFCRWLREKFQAAFPEKVYIEEQLQNGDSRAAVVVSTAPLLIAAYTDELDCIALLRFPYEFVVQYDLREGKRLLTVNTYRQGGQVSADLIPGPNQLHRWTGFHPIIAEFVSDSQQRIEVRKKHILEAEWQRTFSLGKEYVARRPGVARDGRPVYASIPAQ
jgi:hypothetical protein